MPVLVGAEWMAIDPSLWRVRVLMSEDPCEELWRARLRRRRAEPGEVDAQEPQPAFAPFFGEASWRRNGQEDEALLIEPGGVARWTLPFPEAASMAFPLRSSVRLWIQEILPDGRLWHAYFADAEPQARAPLKALAALIEALPPAETRVAAGLESTMGGASAPADDADDPAPKTTSAQAQERSAQRIRKRRSLALAEERARAEDAQARAQEAPGAEESSPRLVAAGLDPRFDREAAEFAAEFLLPNEDER